MQIRQATVVTMVTADTVPGGGQEGGHMTAEYTAQAGYAQLGGPRLHAEPRGADTGHECQGRGQLAAWPVADPRRGLLARRGVAQILPTSVQNTQKNRCGTHGDKYQF